MYASWLFPGDDKVLLLKYQRDDTHAQPYIPMQLDIYNIILYK